MKYDAGIIRRAKKDYPSGHYITGLGRLGHKGASGIISEVIGSVCKTVIYGRIGKTQLLLVLWKAGRWADKGSRRI